MTMFAGYKSKESSYSKDSPSVSIGPSGMKNLEMVKLVLTIQVSSTVKRFHVRNSYELNNRYDPKQDVFVHWIVIKRSLSRSLCTELEMGRLWNLI